MSGVGSRTGPGKHRGGPDDPRPGHKRELLPADERTGVRGHLSDIPAFRPGQQVQPAADGAEPLFLLQSALFQAVRRTAFGRVDGRIGVFHDGGEPDIRERELPEHERGPERESVGSVAAALPPGIRGYSAAIVRYPL